jgi:hypothetical protein
MNTAWLTLAQQSDGGGAAGAVAALFTCMVWLILVILPIVGMWKTYSKAGQPGWAAIIPIYNLIVLLQIVGRPIWWFILMLIPVVNIVIAIIVFVELAKCFGKGIGFAIGLFLLAPIFFLILGFGSAQYTAPTNPVV